jgi:hypothetical protein
MYSNMFFYLLTKVRVDISARNPGKIQAALTDNRRTLNELVLEPMKEEQYYEVLNFVNRRVARSLYAKN